MRSEIMTWHSSVGFSPSSEHAELSQQGPPCTHSLGAGPLRQLLLTPKTQTARPVLEGKLHARGRLGPSLRAGCRTSTPSSPYLGQDAPQDGENNEA